MSTKRWFWLLTALLALGLMGVALVLALALGFFIGHENAAGETPGVPVYSLEQSASSHAGYRHTTLTCGNEVFVNDYEEACLQIATSEPKPVIGRLGSIGNATVCAIPGQPVTSYVAGDCGSEMPAFEPYRNIKQSPFDWRTAHFRTMTTWRQDQFNQFDQPVTTTNAALIAEVVRVLRDGTPVDLDAIPFGPNTNQTTIKLTCDQLPGLLFCPTVYYRGNGTIYLAESMTMDWTPKPPELHARWIPASPLLTEWLKAR
jgi:hypothetical protein